MRKGIDYTIIDEKEHIMHPVPFGQLPVELPYEVDFTPNGKPPLATNEKWLKVKCPKCGGKAKRDAETLDTFFDSSWYWYRYVSPHFKEGPFDTEAVDKLTPVDVYFGGAEHTLGHTMYARFFTKFFHDLHLVDYEEFASKRIQHGVVLGPDGNRMSKSKGNVINPDDLVVEYGSDTVRMYLCFMMPYESTGPWSDTAIAGVHRFLNRVWNLFQRYKDSSAEIYSSKENLFRNELASRLSHKAGPVASRSSSESEGSHRSSLAQTSTSRTNSLSLVNKLQKTIKKVSSDIERMKMNTAIAAMMEFVNEWEEAISFKDAKRFLQILAPFAPHMTEEIWRNVFGEKKSIHVSNWPTIVGEVRDEVVTIPVQVNGKLRTTILANNKELGVRGYVEKLALEDEKVRKYIEDKKYKVIYVPGKILNFVTLS